MGKVYDFCMFYHRFCDSLEDLKCDLKNDKKKHTLIPGIIVAEDTNYWCTIH